MVMSPRNCRAEQWDLMCLTVSTVSSGGRPCLPATHTHTTQAAVSGCCLHQEEEKGEELQHNDTDSVLHWCWSGPWPLTFECWSLWSVARSCWPCRPVSWSPPSPPGTGWEHLRRPAQEPAPWWSHVTFKIQEITHTHNLFSYFFYVWMIYYYYFRVAITYPKVCWHYSSEDDQ